MTDEELAELERLCAAATPGPWKAGECITSGKVHVVCFGHDYDEYGGFGARLDGLGSRGGDRFGKEWRERYEAEIEANRQVVAAARNALPRLIAEVRRLRGTHPAE